MAVVQRKRVRPITTAINTDFSEVLPAGVYSRINYKLSGAYTGSGAGVVALDGAFNYGGRVEVRRGSDVLIGLHGSDWRHLSGHLMRGYNEILPSVIAASGVFLAQAELPLGRLIPFGGIDNRAGDVIFAGRTRGLTNLGTTVTAIGSNKLRFSGETGTFPNGADMHEPRILTSTIDASAASADLQLRRQVANEVEYCCGAFIRNFDASLELGDPNTSRSDGMTREVRIDLERNGTSTEVARYTWGELKQLQLRAGITAASGQVQTGVALAPIVDSDGPGGALTMRKGDALVIRIDTAATIEDEFTATTMAAGDLIYVTPLNFVPRGPGVDAIRRRVARR